jgi:hypothetical protein
VLAGRLYEQQNIAWTTTVIVALTARQPTA